MSDSRLLPCSGSINTLTACRACRAPQLLPVPQSQARHRRWRCCRQADGSRSPGYHSRAPAFSKRHFSSGLGHTESSCLFRVTQHAALHAEGAVALMVTALATSAIPRLGLSRPPLMGSGGVVSRLPSGCRAGAPSC